MKKILYAALFSSFFIQDAAAEKINPWTDCGIGALIFSGLESDFGSALAAISNIFFWDLGTTAVSSATLSPNTCAGADVTAAIFLQNGINEIETELALGSGEHLNTVLDIYSCQKGSHTDIITDFRTTMKEPISSSGYTSLSQVEKSQLYWQNIDSLVNGKYSEHCNP